MAVQHIGESAGSHSEIHLTTQLGEMPVFDTEIKAVSGQVKSILELLDEVGITPEKTYVGATRNLSTPVTGKYFH